MARSRNFAPTEAAQGPIVDDEVGRLFDSTRERDAQPRLRDLPIDRIDPNPFQARREFTDIDQLAQTIRVQGFTSRLRVRPHPDQTGRFQLVYGERRLRAATAAGLKRVPVEIIGYSDDELIEIGLAENIQRQDLTPIEEAQGLQALMERRGYSQRVLAERLGKGRGYVQNRLDLLRAPEDVQQLVAQRPDTLRAAHAIARLPEAAQRETLIAGLMSGAITGDEVLLRVQQLQRAQGKTPGAVPGTQALEAGLGAEHAEHDVPEAELDTRSMTPAKASSASDQSAERRPTPVTAMARILESDVLRLDVMLSRWRMALARATPGERQAFASYIRDHLEPQLKDLRRAVDENQG